MSRRKKRGSTNAPPGGPTPLPPADEFPDGPLTVPGVHHPRTTLSLPTAESDAPDGQNEWPNDAVRPVWDREVTVARQATLSDEEQALLRGNDPPTADEVLAAIDQAGPPAPHRPTLSGIPAAEIPLGQSGPRTLTDFPARQPDEPVTSDEMPPGAAELAAVPVVALEYQSTVRMPEQQPAPAPEQHAAKNEFDAEEKTPLPTDHVPFGGDSGMRPMPAPPADPGQAGGQEAIAGLMATPLDEALKGAEPSAPEIASSTVSGDDGNASATQDAEPPMPVLDAVSLSGGGSPTVPAAQEFDQPPDTQPGVVVNGQFVPGIRDMMPAHNSDSFPEEGTDSGVASDGTVRGYIDFESSGIARTEEMSRDQPKEPAPWKVFPPVPATPPIPDPDAAKMPPAPIKLETLFKASHAARAALAPTAPMEAVKPEPVQTVPTEVPPAVTAAPAGQLAGAVPELVMETAAPSAPVPKAPNAVSPSLYIVPPPPADVRPEAVADFGPDPEVLAALRDIKRKQMKRWLPWVLSCALAVLLLVGIGLGFNLYNVKATESDQSDFAEAMTTCIQERARRKHINPGDAAKECEAVAGRLLK
jgi:hypothetical protein